MKYRIPDMPRMAIPRMVIHSACTIGAAAVGMTFYIGGEATMEDVERIGHVVEEAHDWGLPVVIWGLGARTAS